jgi:hypothetical protein
VRGGHRKYTDKVVNVNFRPTDELVESLACRSARPKVTEHSVARRDLERFYWAVENDTHKFTLEEAMAVSTVIRSGMINDTSDLALVWAYVADNGEIDVALKLRKADPWYIVRLVDMVERKLLEREKGL